MVLFSLQDKYFSRVYGEEEDFGACKMIRIGRLIQPVESQDIGVITLGGAALDGLETRKKIRLVRKLLVMLSRGKGPSLLIENP